MQDPYHTFKSDSRMHTLGLAAWTLTSLLDCLLVTSREIIGQEQRNCSSVLQMMVGVTFFAPQQTACNAPVPHAVSITLDCCHSQVPDMHWAVQAKPDKALLDILQGAEGASLDSGASGSG